MACPMHKVKVLAASEAVMTLGTTLMLRPALAVSRRLMLLAAGLAAAAQLL